MAMIFARPIKPAALKVDAIRVELLAAMRQAANLMEDDFEKTTASWEGDRPGFDKNLSLTGGSGAVVFVGLHDDGSTGAQKYHWVNDGTRPHDIAAGIYTGKSDKRALAFRGLYTAKTIPGVIGSGAGGASGDFVVRARVHHPGTEARRFDQEIARKWQPELVMRMEIAMRAASAASGHGL